MGGWVGWLEKWGLKLISTQVEAVVDLKLELSLAISTVTTTTRTTNSISPINYTRFGPNNKETFLGCDSIDINLVPNKGAVHLLFHTRLLSNISVLIFFSFLPILLA